MKSLLRLTLCLISISFLGGSLTVQAAPAVGDPAPAFTLQDSNGNAVSLSDFKGKIVVLEWTNFTCPYVQKHYVTKNMQWLQKKSAQEGVIWLSVCSSASGKAGYLLPDSWNKALAERDSAAAALLIDDTGVVGRTYGAKTTPEMFIVDAEGKLAYRGAIDSEGTTDPADIVKAQNHVEQALKAMLTGEPVKRTSSLPYGCGIDY